ncbi:MAG: hypothetical protein IJV14_05375, partial [Lachnospiraceae bacterium]|nr:hypothetical protein [Lachnospiraceae bacterium]
MMGTIITLKDGSNHTVLTILDLMDLVDTYMGAEMKTAIEEEFNEAELAHADDDEYIRDLEQENKGLRDHHKEVMEKLRDNQSELNDLNECEVFVCGFRLGARIMLEVLDGNDKWG